MENAHVTLDSPPGTTLSNGAVLVIMLPEYHSGMGRMLLAYTGADSYHPWVTWRQGTDGAMYHGHYFGVFREAVENLYTRAEV